MKKPEFIDVDANPDLNWFSTWVLPIAKKNLQESKGHLTPVLFAFDAEKRGYVVGGISLENDERKDLAAAQMRAFLEDKKAVGCAFLTDSYHHYFTDYAGALADGLDPSNPRAWTKEKREKYMQTRECITAFIEVEDRAYTLRQYYGKRGREIVFEEVEVDQVNTPDGELAIAGRFAGLLPRRRGS
jgi:hypothetical protein